MVHGSGMAVAIPLLWLKGRRGPAAACSPARQPTVCGATRCFMPGTEGQALRPQGVSVERSKPEVVQLQAPPRHLVQLLPRVEPVATQLPVPHCASPRTGSSLKAAAAGPPVQAALKGQAWRQGAPWKGHTLLVLKHQSSGVTARTARRCRAQRVGQCECARPSRGFGREAGGASLGCDHSKGRPDEYSRVRYAARLQLSSMAERTTEQTTQRIHAYSDAMQRARTWRPHGFSHTGCCVLAQDACVLTPLVSFALFKKRQLQFTRSWSGRDLRSWW